MILRLSFCLGRLGLQSPHLGPSRESPWSLGGGRAAASKMASSSSLQIIFAAAAFSPLSRPAATPWLATPPPPAWPMAELRQACPGSARLGRLLHQEAGRRCRTPPATPACQPPCVRPRSRGPAGRPLGPPLARSAPALRCGTLLPGDGRLGNGARDVIPPASQSEALPRRDVPPPGPSPSPGARASERARAEEAGGASSAAARMSGEAPPPRLYIKGWRGARRRHFALDWSSL